MTTLYRRLWLVALIAGVERAGRSPIDLRALNGLAYLANATVPCYDIEPLDATVRKSEDGPMYPQLVWDADRLVGMGLLGISGLVVRDGAVKACAYSITRSGLKLVARSRKAHASFEALSSTLWSIAVAFARSPNSVSANSLLRRDGNYAEHRVTSGDVVDFGEWDFKNWTADAVRRVQETVSHRLVVPSEVAEGSQLVKGFAEDPGVAVDLYAQYLAAERGMVADGGAA